MEDIKTKLRDLIENNKIEDAIKLLKEESAKKGGHLDHIIISLSSRYKRYKKDSLMGLEARDQEFSKIVSDSLELVKALDDPSQIVSSEPVSSGHSNQSSYSKPSEPSSGQSNKYVQMGIGGLAVIGLIALIIVFTGGDDTGFDDPNAVYDDPYVNGGQGAYQDVYNVSGNWSQIGQSFGPDNDCIDCTIDITQTDGSLYIASNIGWAAQLEFNSQSGIFEGLLNWGDVSPGEPEQGAVVYFAETGELVVGTFLQGVEYDMYYAAN